MVLDRRQPPTSTGQANMTISLRVSYAAIREARDHILRETSILLADRPELAVHIRTTAVSELRGIQKALIYTEGQGYALARHIIEGAIDEVDILVRQAERDLADRWCPGFRLMLPESAQASAELNG